MLQLMSDEQQWLEEYRRILDEKFPGLVEEMIIFGSKARGTATEDSDLDVSSSSSMRGTGGRKGRSPNQVTIWLLGPMLYHQS